MKNIFSLLIVVVCSLPVLSFADDPYVAKFVGHYSTGNCKATVDCRSNDCWISITRNGEELGLRADIVRASDDGVGVFSSKESLENTSLFNAVRTSVTEEASISRRHDGYLVSVKKITKRKSLYESFWKVDRENSFEDACDYLVQTDNINDTYGCYGKY